MSNREIGVKKVAHPESSKHSRQHYQKIYIFNMDIPVVLDSSGTPHGPFKKGDMINEGGVPAEILRVLLYHNAITQYKMLLNISTNESQYDIEATHVDVAKANHRRALQLPLDIYIKIFGGHHAI